MVPHLSHGDPFVALAWLCRVFGFSEANDSIAEMRTSPRDSEDPMVGR